MSGGTGQYRFIRPFVEANIARAAELRQRVKSYASARPGISNKEIATALGISWEAAQRHMASIKREWRTEDRAIAERLKGSGSQLADATPKSNPRGQ